MLEVDNPDALAELTSAFEKYEQSLIANDIEALNSLFWDSTLTLRYGPRELLYGHDQIARFRRERGAIDQRRTLRETHITTFGRDFGVASTEFIPADSQRLGRQSQTWVRMSEGWRIVNAHVSYIER